MKRKGKNEPIDGMDRLFGALGGGFAGGLLSILMFVVFADSLPADGSLGFILGASPGVIVGGLFGLSFPRIVIMIADGAFLGL